jgi:hypothetical protein
MFLFHIAWACGQIPGLNGFAMAAEQTQLKADITSIKLQMLDREILETRKEQCNNPNKGFFTRRIQELHQRWYNETKISYILPRCEEL